MTIKTFINLTSGLEKLDKPINSTDVAFIRIQSTACEQKRWEFILQDLDYNLLLYLATGATCNIIDCGAHHTDSRALWQGVEWIKYTLNRRWFNRIIIPMVRKNNCSSYFNDQYKKLSKNTLKKIDYFKKFLLTDHIDIITTSSKSIHHDNNKYFKEKLRQYINENNNTNSQ